MSEEITTNIDVDVAKADLKIHQEMVKCLELSVNTAKNIIVSVHKECLHRCKNVFKGSMNRNDHWIKNYNTRLGPGPSVGIYGTRYFMIDTCNNTKKQKNRRLRYCDDGGAQFWGKNAEARKTNLISLYPNIFKDSMYTGYYNIRQLIENLQAEQEYCNNEENAIKDAIDRGIKIIEVQGQQQISEAATADIKAKVLQNNSFTIAMVILVVAIAYVGVKTFV